MLQGWRPRRRTAWLLPAETQVLLRPGSSSGQRPSLRLEPLRPSSRLSRPAPSAPLRAPPVSPAHFPAPRLGNSSRLAGRLGRPPPHWPRSFGWRARDWWTSAFLPGAARDWLAEAQSAEPGRCRRGLRRRLLRGGRRRRRWRRLAGELQPGVGAGVRAEWGRGPGVPRGGRGWGWAAVPARAANGRGASAPLPPRRLSAWHRRPGASVPSPSARSSSVRWPQAPSASPGPS